MPKSLKLVLGGVYNSFRSVGPTSPEIIVEALSLSSLKGRLFLGLLLLFVGDRVGLILFASALESPRIAFPCLRFVELDDRR